MGSGAAIFAVFPDAGRPARASYQQQPGSLDRILTLHLPGADLRLIPSVIAMTLLAGAVMACGGDATGTGASPATDSPTTSVTDTEGTVTSTSRPPGTTTSPATTEPGTAATTTTTEVPATTTVAAETTTTGASTTTTTTEVPATTTTVAVATVAISDDVPDIEMFDAATGELVSLRSVVKGEKPLLFWFWSPF